MNLSSLFLQGNTNNIEVNGKEMTSSALEQGLRNGMEAISEKAAGQSVTGEVIEMDGKDILLAIGKNQLLRARLEGSMQVETGRQLTFAILKNTGGSKVTLSPLFENMGNDPNVSKALQAAGIPETEITAKAVSLMMQEGMSVDKNSLQQMIRMINLNPQAELETLVQLTRLQIPITEESIFQFQAYKNYEHQLSEGLLQIADSLTETVQGFMGEGNTEAGLALYKEIFTLLTGGENENGILPKEAVLNSQQTAAETGGEAEISQQAVGTHREDSIPRENLALLLTQMKEAGVPEQFLSMLSVKNPTPKELLSGLNTLLSQEILTPEQKNELGKLLTGKEFSSLLKKELTKQWFLEPQEVGEENKVEKLYERLNTQLKNLSHALEETVKADNPLARTVSTVSGNIDFMNQLNQMFTYVQIPLKLQGKEANGELYVYTNKKNLAQKDGKVSALLHLDMEHLGGVDVHVAMEEKRVSTKFYLADDKALDLVAQNIHILNERLEKRGYSMSSEFLHRDEAGNVLEEILKQDKNISVLSGYSFDARA